MMGLEDFSRVHVSEINLDFESAPFGNIVIELGSNRVELSSTQFDLIISQWSDHCCQLPEHENEIESLRSTITDLEVSYDEAKARNYDLRKKLKDISKAVEAAK